MRQLLSLTICFLSFPNSSVAQTSETFDIATFQPPAGWDRQASQSAIQFSTEDKASGAYCLITLFKSIPGLGDSKENFAAAWQAIVKEAVNVSTAPQMQPSNNPEGWQAEMGSAPFEKDGMKGVAVLVTVSGHGKMVNALVLTNTQAYEQVITAFLESVSFKQPETVSQPAPANQDNNASILGTWGVSASGKQNYDDYKNAHAMDNYGYISRQYTFNANGTYGYVSKTFMMRVDKLLLITETGTYQISGSEITISPQKSVIQAWSKRKENADEWGQLLSTQNRPLEKATYQFTKHYFSGIRQWNLVLQFEKATERDGPFSTNRTFSNAWYYAPISPNNPAIELPR